MIAWATSVKAEKHAGVERADRWGIFVGEWAPTFFCLGLALANYETTEAAGLGIHQAPPRLTAATVRTPPTTLPHGRSS
ncbi:hypothetical protein KSNIM_37610 [Kitasatospora sp. DSM 101779]|nr:hypothetical protein [Kitasatospora sp. DSM 101779]